MTDSEDGGEDNHLISTYIHCKNTIYEYIHHFRNYLYSKTVNSKMLLDINSHALLLVFNVDFLGT